MISSLSGAKRCCAACVVVAGALATAAPASARDAYVANSGDGTVSVLSTTTDSQVGTVAIGGEPVDVAITPDGTRAYVTNEAEDSVSAIDTATNAVSGPPIPVGSKPRGIAISPDGMRAYVADYGGDAVSVIDTATGTVSATIPLAPGSEPDGIAISPDGMRAFVAQLGGDVAIVDTATGTVIGSVTDPRGPSQVAIGPRGGRAFVTDSGSSSVTAFNPANGVAVGSVPVGAEPVGIAIEPSGTFAYAASPVDGTLTAINASLDAPVGTLAGFPGATGLAFTPDGASGYATDGGGGAVTILNRASGGVAGSIGVGSKPAGIAIVPDQPPRASILVTPQRRQAKQKLTFHGGASSDPDGRIVDYAWDFGDGGRIEGTSATRVHRYRRPGTYTVTLVATDEEGCSTELVFTGQTASCNGSVVAAATSEIVVGDAHGSGLRLAGGRRQLLRGHLNVFALCPREPCAVRAHARVTMALQRPRRLIKHVRRTGLARANLEAGAWARLPLRLPRGLRRAAARVIRRGGEVRAKVVVIARDEAGSQVLRKRTVKLVLPHRH